MRMGFRLLRRCGIPRNDRACCDCQGTPSCCTSCSNCETAAEYRDVDFEIDPLVFECSAFAEKICDPNCIPDFSQSDSPTVLRKNYGCQQVGYTRSVQYATSTSCCSYYEDDDGACGCSAYDSDFYDSWLNDGACPQPIGGGVQKYTYRQVSGTARVHLQRVSSCFQDIELKPVTSSAQFATCVSGTTNYLRPSGSNQTCASSDPPSGCSSSSCKLLTWEFPCYVCPFCPDDWNGYPIQQSKVYAVISGTFDVIRDYAWHTEPMNGSSSCWPALPASETVEFQIQSLMEGTNRTSDVVFRQAWSKMTAIPTHGGPNSIITGVGVEFNDFTI